jgi:hypothetical protein
MLKDEIEKKINKKNMKNNSSQPWLTCQTNNLCHDIRITP